LHLPRFRRLAALLAVFIFIQAAAPGPALAVDETAMSDREIRELLEKSLNIVELDKEIERIAGQRRETAERIRMLTDRIDDAERELDRRRTQVDEVLRSWYMGERDVLLKAVFSADSLSDLLAMLDYLTEMLSHDKFTLEAYRKQREDWLRERDRLVAEEERLGEIENNLIRQRERVRRLRAEVDEILAASGDIERLRLLIAEWIAWWEHTGLPEVERHFRALADAMENFPGWLAERSDLVKRSGFTYTVRLPEADLNAFLRDQNPLFEHFSFRFEDGVVSAYGRREDADLEVEITGRYAVEDEPEHAVRFHVEKIVFNGFALPESTIRDLERRFDLAFYPQLLVPLVRASGVEADDGVLTVELRIGLRRRDGGSD
jgi:hypothetical protein